MFHQGSPKELISKFTGISLNAIVKLMNHNTELG